MYNIFNLHKQANDVFIENRKVNCYTVKIKKAFLKSNLYYNKDNKSEALKW